MGIDVSENRATGGRSIDQGDLMLWLAGAAIALMGIAWLLLSHPWSTSAVPPEDAPAVTPPSQASVPAPTDTNAPTGQAATDDGLGNPLRMAQLAYKAGMLDQPEQYSAWALFRQVLAKEPNNAAAKQGLAKVAQDLLARAGVALEQGRYDDARGTAKRILAAFPDDSDARSLLAKIRADAPQPSGPPLVAREPVPPAQSGPAPKPVVRAASPPATNPMKRAKQEQSERNVATATAVAPETPQPTTVDQVLKAHEAFRQAMSDNHLLTPANASAEHFVAVLTELAPKNEMTVNAQQLLLKELLSRSQQALEALDTDAARAWIDAAAELGVDPAAVAKARGALTDKLAAMESQRPLPASALKLISYKAPKYPRRAIERNAEGWVDLEFTVAKDGTTRDIKVTDSSSDYFFHAASVAAVRQWRFEPHVFMGRTIAQRVFTKIHFTLSKNQ